MSRAAVFAGAALASACHAAPRDVSPETPGSTGLPPPRPPADAAMVAVIEPPVDARVDAPADAAVDAPPRPTTGIIRGQIVDYYGNVHPAMTVSLRRGKAKPVSQRSDKNGYFTFEGLEPGDYELSFHEAAKGHQHRPALPVKVTLKAGDELPVNVALEPIKMPKANTCCMPYGAPPARRRVV
jgi:hypothetical protein